MESILLSSPSLKEIVKFVAELPTKELFVLYFGYASNFNVLFGNALYSYSKLELDDFLFTDRVQSSTLKEVREVAVSLFPEFEIVTKTVYEPELNSESEKVNLFVKELVVFNVVEVIVLALFPEES